MDGQIHFLSIPLVYKFEVDREGVKGVELKRNNADRMDDILRKPFNTFLIRRADHLSAVDVETAVPP